MRSIDNILIDLTANNINEVSIKQNIIIIFFHKLLSLLPTLRSNNRIKCFIKLIIVNFHPVNIINEYLTYHLILANYLKQKYCILYFIDDLCEIEGFENTLIQI